VRLERRVSERRSMTRRSGLPFGDRRTGDSGLVW
jgi:hypothetical protein